MPRKPDPKKKWVTNGNAAKYNAKHPHHVDRDALHRLLAGRTDHFGRIKMDLRALAAETDINYSNLSVIIREMAEEGRLRKVGGTVQGPKTYIVTNPKEWSQQWASA